MDQISQYMDQFQRIWTVLPKTKSTGSQDWTYELLDPVLVFFFKVDRTKNWSIFIGPSSSFATYESTNNGFVKFKIFHLKTHILLPFISTLNASLILFKYIPLMSLQKDHTGKG